MDLKDDVKPTKEVEGDELMEKVDQDYHKIDKLDKYDEKSFDEQEYSEMSVGQR